MKFKKLDTRATKLARKRARGKTIKSSDLDTLIQLLLDKKQRYENKLTETSDPDKKKKLELRLKIVNAHIDKAREL